MQKPPPESDAQLLVSVVRMQAEDVPQVQQIENEVYPFPWTIGNFMDSLRCGYETWVAHDMNGAVAGYFLMMLAVDEGHLLNITVRPDLQGLGLGRMLLDKAVAVARASRMTSILLEVRPSNQRALVVYGHYGFLQIGRRRGYYPAANQQREDAVVMRLII